jgi:hypothetical protein
MPAQSKAQQRFMGMVHAVQKGDMEAPSKEIEKAADSMTDKAAKDFASTKHKGLPGHVKKENKIDLEDEDLPSAVVPGVSVENTMKTYDASCGCFRTEVVNEAKEEWAGLDTIKRGGYGSPTLRNGDKVRMVVDARKNKYYNGVINGSSIKWEDGAKSELSLSMQASNRGDLQVLRPTTKNESVGVNEQIEIVLNENLDEGIVKDMILTAMIAISAIGGTAYLDNSIGRQLKAGNSVEVSMGQQIFNGNKLNKDTYVLTVNPKQTQPVKIDTSKSTITLNTSNISNSKIKSAVRDQMKKIDPSLDNQKIDKGSKDAASKIKFGYHSGVSIGQGADGNYGLRGPGHFGLGYDIGESADVNQNAVMASIEDLPNNRTQKNFPLPTNRVLWNATGKVCEGRPVVERIKMYEKKGGGWREGVADDEQVYNSLKELHSERKQVKEIKESVRAILKKKVQTESKLNEDISDIVMSGLQMIGIVASSLFLRFLIRYMIGEFLKSTKDTTMNGIKSIIQGVKNAWTSLKNISRIRELEKELKDDEDIKHAILHPKTVDFAKVLRIKLEAKDYDLISKITRNNFR